ncbi:MAG: hypothetical protein J0M24_26750 [Verrucomicrobia bacterium]|jgi:hypothetical protein|nr:hypothetical protein [Verrucomicrobiota bacterium]
MSQSKNALWKTVLAVLVLTSTGCHTVPPAKVADPQALAGKKYLYIVDSTRKDRGFRAEIVRNLTGRGFTVSSGPMNQWGADVQLYLLYEDRWNWDMVMYPAQVKISIYEVATRSLLGSAEFKNTFFHTYADPPEIADELIGRIFGEPAGKFME